MRSIGSYDIADYAVQLFNRWKIGDREKNNGVLVLVAVEDRKVFINTGYGIEGALPDALCKRIVDRDIVPRFKEKDYYGGLDAATTTIIGLVKGEFTADYIRRTRPHSGGLFLTLMFLFIIGVIFFAKGRQATRYARMNNLTFWAAWALLNAAQRRQRGQWNTFSGGHGGGWGGGFGGGGFGGFGGGMSGGGGAGGSW
jgi:uncharacterized protein